MGGRGKAFGSSGRDEAIVNRMFMNEGGKFVFHGDNLKDALKFAKENGLTDAEARAINMYTDRKYDELNKALLNDKMTPELKSLENTLNSGLDKIKAHSGIVYRGTYLSEEQIKRYINIEKAGTSIVEKAFISTSKDKDKAFKDNVEFKIHSKKGREITRISKYGDIEDEVLFKSKSKFNVRSVIKKQHGEYQIILEEI